ncbi:release factor glutamine methyltransferase [Synergistales bacterium]|nr:release factor glutamine methyltransferase [Synergistales bacterium]
MRLSDLRADVIKILTASSEDKKSASFEADEIIGGALETARAFLHAHPEKIIDGSRLGAIMSAARLRAEGMPLAYIIGNALFRGRVMAVGEGVLIPRPETEILTAIADDYIKGIGGRAVFADWCAGSGCIGITLLADNPASRCFAADVSERALSYARINAEACGVTGRMSFINCASPSESGIAENSLDMIVTNPPYIPAGEISSLERQVRVYEPREALDGGMDGLDVCRIILSEAPRLMKDGAVLIMETGGGEQPDETARMAAVGSSLRFIKKIPDHRNIDRFVVYAKMNG